MKYQIKMKVGSPASHDITADSFGESGRLTTFFNITEKGGKRSVSAFPSEDIQSILPLEGNDA